MLIAAVALGPRGAACNTQGSNGSDVEGALSGAIEIDGSSTVFPISEAIAEEFSAEARDVAASASVSPAPAAGSRSSAPATSTSPTPPGRSRTTRRRPAGKEGIEFTELKVAIDGLSVVVNEDNDFAECLTVEELKKIWEPDSSGQDVEGRARLPSRTRRSSCTGRVPTPARSTTSPTRSSARKAHRATDYTPSEDDNVLVQGVAGDENALGYFGYAYYVPNTDKLKALGVDGGDGCVVPDRGDDRGRRATRRCRVRSTSTSSNEALGEEHVAGLRRVLPRQRQRHPPDVGYIAVPDEDLAGVEGRAGRSHRRRRPSRRSGLLDTGPPTPRNRGGALGTPRLQLSR